MMQDPNLLVTPSAPSPVEQPANTFPANATASPVEGSDSVLLGASVGDSLTSTAPPGNSDVLDDEPVLGAVSPITANAYQLDPPADKLDAIATLAAQDGAPPSDQADRPWDTTAAGEGASATIPSSPPPTTLQETSAPEASSPTGVGAHEDARSNVQEATEELMVRAIVADAPPLTSAATDTAPETTGEIAAQTSGAGTDVSASSPTLVAETVLPTEQEPQQATEKTMPASVAPLAPGVIVGDRYTIVAQGPDDSGARTFEATDARGYEHCWSCGSSGNGPRTRFCQHCGASVQNHPVTLIESPTPTGRQDEIAYGAVFLYPKPERRLFGGDGIGIEVGAYSAEGRHHPNEDSYWHQTQIVSANSERRSLTIALLCDGMGGYAPGSGLISSRIATLAGTAIAGALAEVAAADQTLSAEEMERIVRAGISVANNMVVSEIERSGEMGSTLVAAIIYGDAAYIANVGDSRVYYIDPHGASTVITHDQSLVGKAVQEGRLAEKDMYDAPGANIILHALGERDVQDMADWYVHPLEPGGRIVLCTDGYWKTMRGVVKPEPNAPEGAATNALFTTETLGAVAANMVEAALMQGSDDNTTVVLIAVG